MRYKIFTYSVPPPEEPEELNSFLSSHKILSVHYEIALKGNTPYIIYIVEYLESGKSGKERQSKVDYREKLSEENFQIFTQLRELRKSVAEREGVPMYTVFTNAQLAEMVEKRVSSLQDMLSISGIGQAKVDKYGQEFINLCSELFPASTETGEQQ